MVNIVSGERVVIDVWIKDESGNPYPLSSSDVLKVDIVDSVGKVYRVDGVVKDGANGVAEFVVAQSITRRLSAGNGSMYVWLYPGGSSDNVLNVTIESIFVVR